MFLGKTVREGRRRFKKEREDLAAADLFLVNFQEACPGAAPYHEKPHEIRSHGGYKTETEGQGCPRGINGFCKQELQQINIAVETAWGLL